MHDGAADFMKSESLFSVCNAQLHEKIRRGLMSADSALPRDYLGVEKTFPLQVIISLLLVMYLLYIFFKGF